MPRWAPIVRRLSEKGTAAAAAAAAADKSSVLVMLLTTLFYIIHGKHVKQTESVMRALLMIISSNLPWSGRFSGHASVRKVARAVRALTQSKVNTDTYP